MYNQFKGRNIFSGKQNIHLINQYKSKNFHNTRFSILKIMYNMYSNTGEKTDILPSMLEFYKCFGLIQFHLRTYDIFQIKCMLIQL